MVGASGIEPLTLATSKQCSAPELRAYTITPSKKPGVFLRSYAPDTGLLPPSRRSPS